LAQPDPELVKRLMAEVGMRQRAGCGHAREGAAG